MISIRSIFIIYHLPALVQSAVEVGEVKGQEGNDVGEGGALEKWHVYDFLSSRK